MIGSRVERDHTAWLTRSTAALATPAAAWVIGIATSLVIWYAWGYLNPTPIYHDEASYLFQARTFALGRLANPVPPVAEFFEQFHVLVTPSYASKYPPGAALLMVPGVWLGIPALVPVVLGGISGAFFFLLARRAATPWVALGAWLLWLSASRTLEWAGSYMSENTSAALWLVGWWTLLAWRDTGRRKWLVATAACAAWMAITRPVTAVAYTIPVAVVVLTLVARRRQWRDLTLAIATGTVIVGIVPLTNYAVLGDWRSMPWSTYARQYIPSDRIGFGLDPTPPERALPPDIAGLNNSSMEFYANHVIATAPVMFVRRLTWVLSDMFKGARLVLLPFALIGLASATVEVAFALASALLLLVMYLAYGHAPDWTIYYFEIQPVLAFLAALGFWRVSAVVAAAASPRGWRNVPFRQIAAGPAVATMLFALVALPHVRSVASTARQTKQGIMGHQRQFFKAAASIPDQRAIVFIRYAPWHNIHQSLIANDPDLARAHVWLVYDRGDDNARLLRAAPDRVAYLFDERRFRIDRYGR